MSCLLYHSRAHTGWSSWLLMPLWPNPSPLWLSEINWHMLICPFSQLKQSTAHCLRLQGLLGWRLQEMLTLSCCLPA